MRRPTGQLLRYGTKTNGLTWGVRLRYRGERRFMVLGSEADGMDEAGALEEMERIVDMARSGTLELGSDEGTLNGLIHEVLRESSDRDPHQLADTVLERASEEMVRNELWNLIADRVRELVRRERKYAARNGRRADVLRSRVALEDDWKFLGECSVTEVEWLAAEYDRRAGENAEYARRMHALAEEMRGADAETVADLSDDARDRALQGMETITRAARARRELVVA